MLLNGFAELKLWQLLFRGETNMLYYILGVFLMIAQVIIPQTSAIHSTTHIMHVAYYYKALSRLYNNILVPVYSLLNLLLLLFLLLLIKHLTIKNCDKIFLSHF